MAKKYKVGQKFTNAHGDKVIVTSILPNGGATVNYAAGSGKTGYAGTIIGNMLTKYGQSFSDNSSKDFVNLEQLDFDDRFSYEDYENFVEEHPDGDLNIFMQEQFTQAQIDTLKKIDEAIDEEVIPMTVLHEGRDDFVDERYTTRKGRQIARWLHEQYATAYGDTENFRLAKMKIATIYEITEAGGYKHGGYDDNPLIDFTSNKVFKPALREAVVMLKDPSMSESDITAVRVKLGLCKYGDDHIGHSEDFCGQQCINNVEKYGAYRLPDPVW